MPLSQALPPTDPLYERDAFLTEFSAVVLACRPEGDGFCAALSATAFYPEGGGQPFDTGVLDGASVTAVHEQAGVIWHSLDKPVPVGKTVWGRIDWQRRRDHMEQHTGEHILSGCLHRLFGAENVGFHIGDPAVRMDIDLPLTAQQLARAEEAANEAVRADTPVRIWTPGREELAATKYRSKKALDGPVRLVEAGGDVCACCGTHLKSTGQVGLIKILSAQPYKGGLRLRVACGQRACAAVAQVWQDAEEAGRQLSVGPGKLSAAAKTFLTHDADNRMRIAALQHQMIRLLAAYPQTGEPGGIRVEIVEGLDERAAADLCARLGNEKPCAVLIPGLGGENGAPVRWVIAASQGDVRPAAQALNAAFGGRGGGTARLCQGTAPARVEEVTAWLQAHF